MSIETTRPVGTSLPSSLNKRDGSVAGAKEATAVESKNVSMRREDPPSAQSLGSVEKMVDPTQGSQTEGENQVDGNTTIKFPELVDEVEKLNIAAQNINRSIEFSVDDDIERTIITVRDKETEEVIRQIPAEELVDISKKMQAMLDDKEQGSGFLFSSSA